VRVALPLRASKICKGLAYYVKGVGDVDFDDHVRTEALEGKDANIDVNI
jgi:hypothetical protein